MGRVARGPRSSPAREGRVPLARDQAHRRHRAARQDSRARRARDSASGEVGLQPDFQVRHRDRPPLRPPVSRSHAAITDPARFGELLRSIDAYKGGPVVRAALRLAPLVFLRPGELRKAQWSEFDLDAGLWEVPSERMKLPKADKALSGGHLVPLSRQAVAILRELRALTGHGHYVFPSPRTEVRGRCRTAACLLPCAAWGTTATQCPDMSHPQAI